MAYRLFITNKNYSSWSMRPWLLMRVLGIPFVEEMVPMDPNLERQTAFFSFSPTGRVPCLHATHDAAQGDPSLGPLVVWDSLAIAEFLAERHPGSGVWPADDAARAFARCASAEMHSAFAVIREEMSMSCGIRVQLPPDQRSAALTNDLERLAALWAEGLRRFGGPWLAGKEFGAVDAMFAPVAVRLQTYGVGLQGEGVMDYAARVLALDPAKEWIEDGTQEEWREPLHDKLCLAGGRTLLEDKRKGAAINE